MSISVYECGQCHTLVGGGIFMSDTRSHLDSGELDERHFKYGRYQEIIARADCPVCDNEIINEDD